MFACIYIYIYVHLTQQGVAGFCVVMEGDGEEEVKDNDDHGSPMQALMNDL